MNERAWSSPAESATTLDPNVRFLKILPTISMIADKAFRRFDPDAREEAIAEIVAATFVSYVKLVRRGRERFAYPATLARFALKQYFSGRRVGGRFTTVDVLAEGTRRRRGLVVEGLAEQKSVSGQDSRPARISSFADEVAFRQDFATWLRRQSPRDRRIVRALALGRSLRIVAQDAGVSSSRVSQLRRRLWISWSDFRDSVS